MHYIQRLVASLLLTAMPALAQAQSEAPDMVGTWVSVEGEIGHWSGTLRPLGETIATLEVEAQVGGVFRGTIIYDNDESGPEFEGRDGIRHLLVEPVLGVVDWDGETIVVVDRWDQTIHRGRLVDANTMEVIAYEAGDYAVVNRMILVRQ